MPAANTNWTFEELSFDFQNDYEKAREDFHAHSAKSQLLHEMIMERYQVKDFESEVVKVLEKKRVEIRDQADKLYDVQKYLNNLTKGYPFNVPPRVGRHMVKFGLTQEQAEMFLNIHKSHMAAMGSENQKKYGLAYVENVIWDAEEDCLKVYYEDIWWHYDRRGQWY
jgi:hypothetical protein